jgi:hypothetical protein
MIIGTLKYTEGAVEGTALIDSLSCVVISLTAVLATFFIAFVVLTAAFLMAFAPVFKVAFAAVTKDVGPTPPVFGFVDRAFIGLYPVEGFC